MLGNRFPVMAEIFEIELVAIMQTHDLTRFVHAKGCAIGRKPHYLVLVAAMGAADIVEINDASAHGETVGDEIDDGAADRQGNHHHLMEGSGPKKTREMMRSTAITGQ
jgi:hypothetical protein